PINETFVANQWFPFPLAESWAKVFPDITGFFGMMRLSVNDPGFYYSLIYCALMVLFGIRRIKKRNTPYVTRQTQVLLAIQIIPLFLLPYLILPWMGHAGLFGNQMVASPVGEETLQEWKNLKSAFEEEAASQNKAGEEAATILARSRRFIDSAKGSFSVYLPDSTAEENTEGSEAPSEDGAASTEAPEGDPAPAAPAEGGEKNGAPKGEGKAKEGPKSAEKADAPAEGKPAE
ncbi:MAG: hypothetical protein AAGC68_12805, partial [Verrucomicrobiota bacterium]